MLSFSLHSVKDTLAPAYRMEKVKRGEYDIFKQQLSLFIDGLNNNETEEHNKNNIIYLLKSAWYGSRFAINTKNSNDLVIHSDAGSGSPIGVLFEVKSPANKVEMINVEQPNSKALWQLLLYYLRARIDNKENNIRHLIVTNAWQWFLFDATWWDTHVHQNKLLRKQYEDYKQSGNNTSYFFESIAQPFWGSLKIQMPCTQIDFTQYKKWIDTNDTDTLVNIYKILSPVHLLKQPFANDSNSLDTGFFYELLYILGLEEKKEKGKKIITRRQAPQPASLVENIISKLESKNSLSKIANLTEYGTNREEQLWGVAMELCVTWLNRILFIKLLEGQLMGYHPNKPEYMFMNVDFLHTFNDLNQLFFDILAQPVKKRSQLQEKYKHVPYLNSSLFERTALEQQTFEIESIDSNLLLPLLPNTVLKDPLGKRRVGKTFLLPYLLRFLDAYDFSSVSNELIQVENKNLINASVLGLIFEKINGYKDGSFFTPGSVTMYMCSESIRKAIIQKFNTVKGWNCVHFKDLVNKMRDIEMAEANAIVNSLRICDPAVGSGHFLVSALNEIIAIKSELRILTDRQGDWIKDCNIIVANDALQIYTHRHILHTYKPEMIESQRLQESLFHEKQTIIENCIFGVDINPNSVKICRLRLWIELLKHAYYTEQSNYTELETLPNIDINIKFGNSLLYRFALDADLSHALKNSKWNIDTYKTAVQTYRQARNWVHKQEIEKLINDIKDNFRTEIDRTHPIAQELKKVGDEHYQLLIQNGMYDDTP